MLVAVVPVALTWETRMGIQTPAGTPENKTVVPSFIMTVIFPEPPTQRARETLTRLAESLGVTASALSAGEFKDSNFQSCKSMAGILNLVRELWESVCRSPQKPSWRPIRPGRRAC